MCNFVSQKHTYVETQHSKTYCNTNLNNTNIFY